jgi:hypothetical protein
VVRLVTAATGIPPQVSVDAEAAGYPEPVGLLAEGERRIVLCLEEDEVLAVSDGLGPGRLAKLLRAAVADTHAPATGTAVVNGAIRLPAATPVSPACLVGCRPGEQAARR